MPWLVTTPAWPTLASHFAGISTRVVVGPVVAAAAAAGAVVAASAVVLCPRVRPGRRHASTPSPQASSAPPGSGGSSFGS